MDHLVKYLQCKQEDLSPDPVYPTEKSGLGKSHVCDVETEGLLVLPICTV